MSEETARRRQQRSCYPASHVNTCSDHHSNFLERRPKVQVPSRLQGCVTEIVPEAHSLVDAGVLDGYALHLCSKNTASRNHMHKLVRALVCLASCIATLKVCYSSSLGCCHVLHHTRHSLLQPFCICAVTSRSHVQTMPNCLFSTGKLNWHCGSSMPLHSMQLQLVMPCIPSWAGNQQAASLP